MKNNFAFFAFGLTAFVFVSCGPLVTLPPDVLEYSSTDHVTITNTVTSFQSTNSFSQAAAQVNLLSRSNQTITLQSEGRILIAGGSDAQQNITRNTELLDPVSGVIATQGLLATARTDAASTLLSNNWTMVCGGNNAVPVAIGSCEIFTPTLGGFTQVAPLSTPRDGLTLTAITNAQNSAVQALAAGGVDASGTLLSSAAIYTAATPTPTPTSSTSTPTSVAQGPAAGTWVATGNLNVARKRAIAIKLPSGDILVFGGQDAASAALSSSELYSVSSKTWTLTGSLGVARFAHAAVLLNDGRVWVVGGRDSGGMPIAQSEIYDPVAKTWALSQTLITARSYPAVALQKNNFAWVAGGFDGTATPISGSEIFDPQGNTLIPGPSLNIPRGKNTAIRLSSGVIWTGSGIDNNGFPTYQSEVYDSGAATVNLLGSSLSFRKSHSLNFIPSTNKVIIAGGLSATSAVLGTSQVFDVASASITAGPALKTARGFHTATLMKDGKVLLSGGQGTILPYLAATEIYYPAFGGFGTAGSLNLGRRDHQAVLLNDGRVLAFGGRTAGGITNTTELFNPAANGTVGGTANNTWTGTANMISARADAASLLMPDGRVLVVGGVNATSTTVATTEIYDPVLGTWSAGPVLTNARSLHKIIVSQGILWVVGGLSSAATPLTSVESLSLPISGSSTFIAAPSLTIARSNFSLQVLNSNALLVSGGAGAAGAASSSELISNLGSSWALVGAFNSARNLPLSVALTDGRVFFEGGESGTSASTGEFFSVYSSIQLSISQGLAPYIFKVFFGAGTLYPQQAGLLIPSSLPGTIEVQVTDQVGDSANADFNFN